MNHNIDWETYKINRALSAFWLVLLCAVSILAMVR